MQGDNFKAVSPEVSAWALEAHFKRQALPVRLTNRGRHGKHRLRSSAERQRMREIQIQAFCDRNGITLEQREAYIALIRSTGLPASEAMAVIKSERSA